MPFEEGNQLGKKAKVFEAALKRAIAQDDGKKIRAAVDKLLDEAAEGQPWAIQMLADRLDGKAVQSIENKTELTYGHHSIPVSERLPDPLATAAGAAVGSDSKGIH